MRYFFMAFVFSCLAYANQYSISRWGRWDGGLGEQQRIALGDFTKASPPKGFSVELTPDPNPAGSVITEITSLGTAKHYKLVLHIANYGTKVVTAEVWQL
jgi:hypothetical protein